MRNAPQDAGMALIEVLVALVIFAALLVVMNHSVAVGLAGLRAAEREAEAIDVAQSVLAEAGRTFPLAPGGVHQGKAAGFTWEARMAPYVAPGLEGAAGGQDVAPNAVRVSVRVAWKEQRSGRPRTLALGTIKLAGAP